MSRGFSLIELMISLALFGLIATGAMSLVTSGARTQARSARVDLAQSGVRSGLDFITRDVQSASAGARSSSVTKGATGTTVNIIVVGDNVGSTGTDTLEIWSIDASKMATVATDVATTTATLTVDSAAAFAANDWVMLCDYNVGTIVQLSTASGTTLTIPQPNTFPTTGGFSSFTKLQAWVFKTRHTTYSVVPTQFGTKTTSSDSSTLMVDLDDGNGVQPLAEGVEDFQVALAIDSDGDGVIAAEKGATAGDDEWVFNVSGETAPASLANLKAVRVTLVGKSTSKDSGSFPKRPTIEDHAAGTADGFFRRIVRSEISVRNFNL